MIGFSAEFTYPSQKNTDQTSGLALIENPYKMLKPSQQKMKHPVTIATVLAAFISICSRLS